MMRLFKKILSRIALCGAEDEYRKFGHLQVFDRPSYADITEARLVHLKSMDLPIAGKTVIDVGCGIGRLSESFVEQGCDVFCVDGREENILKLKDLYPDRKAAVLDLEAEDIVKCGTFDILFCYGLLYHLSDPFGFLKQAFKICREMMIIETCITDARDPVLRLVEEQRANVSQALYGIGSRPSPSYITTCLKLIGFKHIYAPVEMPDHKQFRYKMVNDFSHLKGGEPIRGIFIASHRQLANEKLKPLLTT